jgi:SulP family sulfate permease
VPVIDSTGLHALQDLVRRTQKQGTLILLADVHTLLYAAVSRSTLLRDIGPENVLSHIDPALERARQFLGLPPRAPSPGTEGQPASTV